MLIRPKVWILVQECHSSLSHRPRILSPSAMLLWQAPYTWAADGVVTGDWLSPGFIKGNKETPRTLIFVGLNNLASALALYFISSSQPPCPLGMLTMPSFEMMKPDVRKGHLLRDRAADGGLLFRSGFPEWRRLSWTPLPQKLHWPAGLIISTDHAGLPARLKVGPDLLLLWLIGIGKGGRRWEGEGEREEGKEGERKILLNVFVVASQVALVVKDPPSKAGYRGDQEDPLEEGMATQSSVLA